VTVLPTIPAFGVRVIEDGTWKGSSAIVAPLDTIWMYIVPKALPGTVTEVEIAPLASVETNADVKPSQVK
jgi:hypothetical protein